MKVTREHSFVSAEIEVGKRQRLDHLPAILHRTGFDVVVSMPGATTECVRVFTQALGMELSTFSLVISSRPTSTNGVLIKIRIPEIGRAALIHIREDASVTSHGFAAGHFT